MVIGAEEREMSEWVWVEKEVGKRKEMNMQGNQDLRYPSPILLNDERSMQGKSFLPCTGQ